MGCERSIIHATIAPHMFVSRALFLDPLLSLGPEFQQSHSISGHQMKAGKGCDSDVVHHFDSQPRPYLTAGTLGRLSSGRICFAVSSNI
jgi:hypothetical protein